MKGPYFRCKGCDFTLGVRAAICRSAFSATWNCPSYLPPRDVVVYVVVGGGVEINRADKRTAHAKESRLIDICCSWRHSVNSSHGKPGLKSAWFTVDLHGGPGEHVQVVAEVAVVVPARVAAENTRG